MRVALSAGIWCVVAAAMLPVAGCRIINSHSSESVSGRYVSPSTFDKIEPGRTTEDWLVSAFGPPTSRGKGDDGAELLKWEYSRQRSSSGGVILLFRTSSSKVERSAAYAEVKDGVVVRAWRDG